MINQPDRVVHDSSQSVPVPLKLNGDTGIKIGVLFASGNQLIQGELSLLLGIEHERNEEKQDNKKLFMHIDMDSLAGLSRMKVLFS
jgi:hypothetical protein